MKSSPGRWPATIAALAAAIPFAAADADPTSAELLQRIDELSQKVLVLERKLENQDEVTKTAVASTPVVKASPKGFSFQSADAQNVVKLRGPCTRTGGFSSATIRAACRLTDTWQATRVRPILEGTLGGIYDFRFTPDFGQGRTVIQDAYVTAKVQARVPGDGRQVQDASRPRAPAVGQRHPFRGACLPDEPRPQSRHRPAGGGQLTERSLELRGRLVQRLQRRWQQRDLYGHRP